MLRGKNEDLNRTPNHLHEFNRKWKILSDERKDTARALDESLEVSALQSSSTSVTRDNKWPQLFSNAWGKSKGVFVNYLGQCFVQLHSEKTDQCFACCKYDCKLTDKRYIKLNDRRKMCRDCHSVAVLDSEKANVVFDKVHQFYEELNIKVDKNVPFFLVDQIGMDTYAGHKKWTCATWHFDDR